MKISIYNCIFIYKQRFIFVLMLFLFVFNKANILVFAESATETVDGYMYNLNADSKYEVDLEGNKTRIQPGTQLGQLSLTGAIESSYDLDGFKTYEVSDGNVMMNYTLLKNIVDQESGAWNITEDNSKVVNKIELDEKINNGVLIIQSSLDKKKWTTLKKVYDIAGKSLKSDIFTTTDIQQINGTYFRVIIAYKAKRQLDDKKVLFVNVDSFEYKKCIELYQFYIIDNEELLRNSSKPSDTPKKELGNKIKTLEDKGFSGNEIIDKKDPHYGWDIGTFYINGYTRETKDTDETPVFLKKVGDRVTLWFSLKQDINKLNSNDKLSIASDKNASDQYFETPVTNFRRGALIIRFTDYEGKKHDPVIYTDFLAANASTTANTKVELFEEGDYEVALDYSIKDSKGVNSYTDYRIFFKYKVRNGNSMAFPFDVITGNELSDKDITENGFKFDMAKSRYLTIDVKRIVLNKSGTDIKEDVRYNRPAKDSDEYSEEGVYEFTVRNIYTDEATTKTIYVGSDPALKALALNNLSVSELENKLKNGYELGDDGSLSLPYVDDAEDITVNTNAVENNVTSETNSFVEEDDIDNNVIDENNMAAEGNNQVEEASVSNLTHLDSVLEMINKYKNIIICGVVALFILIIGILIGKGKKRKGDS
ncbi:MAG: hypothetical protein J5476_12730 [Lachnospiraceae bacterium]|nr:hypothetical protein [Lachnospiraceae bacterium]